MILARCAQACSAERQCSCSCALLRRQKSLSGSAARGVVAGAPSGRHELAADEAPVAGEAGIVPCGGYRPLRRTVSEAKMPERVWEDEVVINRCARDSGATTSG